MLRQGQILVEKSLAVYLFELVSTCSLVFISNESMYRLCSLRQPPFQAGRAHLQTDWLNPLYINCDSSRFHLAFGTTFHRDPWCILVLPARTGMKIYGSAPRSTKKTSTSGTFFAHPDSSCYVFHVKNPRTRRGFPCSTLELGRLVPVLMVRSQQFRSFRSVSWPPNGVSNGPSNYKRFPVVSAHFAQIVYPLSVFFHGSLLVSFCWHCLPKYFEGPGMLWLPPVGFPTHRHRLHLGMLRLETLPWPKQCQPP